VLLIRYINIKYLLEGIRVPHVLTLANATVGFPKLNDVTRRSPKNLMRMLGPRGNPQARNLFEIVAYLQQAEGVRFEVRPARVPYARTGGRTPHGSKRGS
jgi:hypothetical protein